jgi:hypothetical protein
LQTGLKSPRDLNDPFSISTEWQIPFEGGPSPDDSEPPTSVREAGAAEIVIFEWAGHSRAARLGESLTWKVLDSSAIRFTELPEITKGAFALIEDCINVFDYES